MTTAWRLLLCLFIAAAASCGGSGTRRAAEGNPSWALVDDPPADFTLAVTVYPPATSPERAAETLPRYARGLRALVQPDLSLRARQGRVTIHTYPPLTRTLTPEQYQRLWWDMRDSGLLRDGHPDEVSSPEAAAPEPQAPPLPRGLYIVSYVAAGHRRALAVDPVLSNDAPGVRRLVDRLAALAWIE